VTGVGAQTESKVGGGSVVTGGGGGVVVTGGGGGGGSHVGSSVGVVSPLKISVIM